MDEHHGAMITPQIHTKPTKKNKQSFFSAKKPVWFVAKCCVIIVTCNKISFEKPSNHEHKNPLKVVLGPRAARARAPKVSPN